MNQGQFDVAYYLRLGYTETDARLIVARNREQASQVLSEKQALNRERFSLLSSQERQLIKLPSQPRRH